MSKEPSARQDVYFVTNLKDRREQMGLKQADLARMMVDAGWEYFTQSTVSRLEKFDRPLRLGEAYALAYCVDRNPPYLSLPPEKFKIADKLLTATTEAKRARSELLYATAVFSDRTGHLRYLMGQSEDLKIDELDDELAGRVKASMAEAEKLIGAEAVDLVRDEIERVERPPEPGDDRGFNPEA
ncbi:MAG: helix-turn-helix domain-containing protein [Brevibacterium aurantiacum]|uniref:helix-turn-helix domain-containing protein n=1 Tax=Brevibacterium aurantiacum TaxID=273384 RepID=UPI003F90579A